MRGAAVGGDAHFDISVANYRRFPPCLQDALLRNTAEPADNLTGSGCVIKTLPK